MTDSEIIQWLDVHLGSLKRLDTGWHASRSIEITPQWFHYYDARAKTPTEAIEKVEMEFTSDLIAIFFKTFAFAPGLAVAVLSDFLTHLTTNNQEDNTQVWPRVDAGSAQLSLLNLTERTTHDHKQSKTRRARTEQV